VARQEPGRYLYCVVRAPDERTLEGLVPVCGDGPVRLVAAGGLGAVVSDCELADVDTSRANLIAHERVLERVMTDMPLLPVRFGTVTSAGEGREDVQRLLVARRQEFEGLLRDMERRVELGVKALWRDQAAVFADIMAGSPTLRQLRDRIQSRPSRVPQMERVRLGEMVKQTLDRRRTAQARHILASLVPLSTRVVENPILLDRMIVNAAFLVERDRDGEFDRTVRELDRELAPDVLFRYVGPVPPYNFVHVTVDWAAVRSVTWA
jgi:Gas vesicle synthesis protein GvpL/GvpF